MNQAQQEALTAHYATLVERHGLQPEGVQMSAEGQAFRFDRLLDVIEVPDASVLDLGCGTGAMYPFLMARFPECAYTGVDVVPTAIELACEAHPAGEFLCHNVLEAPLNRRFDYVLMSVLFNNAGFSAEEFLRQAARAAFAHCERAVAFNFLSTRRSFSSSEMAYHNPAAVLSFVISEITPRVLLDHHYERADVAVVMYRV